MVKKTDQGPTTSNEKPYPCHRHSARCANHTDSCTHWGTRSATWPTWLAFGFRPIIFRLSRRRQNSQTTTRSREASVAPRGMRIWLRVSPKLTADLVTLLGLVLPLTPAASRDTPNQLGPGADETLAAGRRITALAAFTRVSNLHHGAPEQSTSVARSLSLPERVRLDLYRPHCPEIGPSQCLNGPAPRK